jgi:hypothetical protein
MAKGILSPNDGFVFDDMKLSSPISSVGGLHLIKFEINGRPLYLQPPACKTKNGIVTVGGKRMHCDLVFTNEHAEFIRWIENLESFCQKRLFENRRLWFETDLEETDIETSFSSSLKLYKAGRQYLLRASVPCNLGNCGMKIYDESQTIVGIDAITDDSNVMTILEFQGIRTSARSFHLDIEIKQMMVLPEDRLFETCLLSTPSHHSNNKRTTFDTTTKIIPSGVDDGRETLPEPEPENIIVELSEEEKEPKGKEEPNELLPSVIVSDDTDDDDNNEDENYTTAKNRISVPILSSPGLCEVELDLDNLPPSSSTEIMQVKPRDEVYYKMYREAMQNAVNARNLALTSYLEAKRIKNTYMLDDLGEDDEEKILQFDFSKNPSPSPNT